MKRILSFIFLTIGFVSLVSCGEPTEITLPNKKVTVTDVLNFKDKPYSGKVKVNLAEKIQGYEGYFTFKEGHLDGLTELKNEKEKQYIKFTIIDGKFDGDVIIKDPKQSVSIELNVSNGIITKTVANLQNHTKYDLSLSNGLTNGTMEAGGQKLDFKDGLAQVKLPQGTVEIKLSVDQTTGDMTMETSTNGQSTGKQSAPNQFTPQFLEKFLFDEIRKMN